jgi:hypothetical protein
MKNSGIESNYWSNTLLVKSFHWFCILLASISPLISQTDSLARELVVIADKLNFRTGPSTESEIFDTLVEGDLVTWLATERFPDCNPGNDCFIKVKRKNASEIGYIFGTFVKYADVAFLRQNVYRHRNQKLQVGNWYGILESTKGIILEKVTPSVASINSISTLVCEDEKYELLICSQEILTEGQINGKIFNSPFQHINIGTLSHLLQLDSSVYSMAITGTSEFHIIDRLQRKNERILFLTTTAKSSTLISTSKQDLSNSFNLLAPQGEIGFIVHFVGDLNSDGTPEIILSEGDNKNRLVYYFKSNENGQLALQSHSVGQPIIFYYDNPIDMLRHNMNSEAKR